MQKSVPAYIPGVTIPLVLAAASTPVTLRRGVVYRVVADVDMWINRWGATATNADMYVPAKNEVFIVIENVDTQQNAQMTVTVLGVGAGRAYFTPVITPVATY